MKIRDLFLLFWILLLIPLTIGGAYFSYQQSRQRVRELNQITPLSETDIQQVIRLVLELEDAEETETESIEEPAGIQATPVLPTPVPTESTIQPESTQQVVEPEVTQEAIPTVESTEQAVEIAAVEEVEIDPRRVTILLMGIDQREGEEGQFRTDTMMVLSLDPIAKTGAMLSIPRDLWVSIPGGFGESRINTANFIGDNPEVSYPGGGPTLAMKTVEKVIGVPIDHYVLINFDAFITLVDVIGPIEVCPPEAIDDPKYPDGSYGYQPIYIEAGCQEMPAERLLQYSRTRATSGGDFDRATRQQEVILATRDKILSLGGVTSLLGDALTLWESVSSNIKTDLTLDEMIALARAAQDVEKICKGTIGTGEVLIGTAPDASDILIPIGTDIISLVSDLFRANCPDETVPEAPLTLPEFSLDPSAVPQEVQQETPTIAVLNGTPILGRARALETYLESYVDVAKIGNYTSTSVTETYVIFYGEHLNSAAYVAQILAALNNGQKPRVERGQGSSPDGDVVVIIGTDLVLSTGE
ncbi:MAG: LCP family protein [Anaerolineae bacterium]|nr:LCP family protein [Anaerolineae bacterium]